MELEAGKSRGARRTHIIERPRLTRLLDETDARIILLIAPAGYGKTTLARQWLSSRSHHWYRGTYATGDVAALAMGLAETASRIVPGASEHLRSRLRNSKAPSEEARALAELLAGGLLAWPQDAWLAFDDYQFACDSAPAEEFVKHLASNCPLRLIVASRTRPRWATARLTLYGEILEIGRALLTMDQTEASLVLNHHPNNKAGGLFSLADGWPALIGLATHSIHSEVPGEAIPEELYSFFAEELYQAADPDLQRSFRRLSLAPYVTRDIAEIVVDGNPDRSIEQGLELGFLVPTRERFEFHPLLRAFLESKFDKRKDDPSGRLLVALARLLIQSREWDSVFDLATRFYQDALLCELLEASLAHMLDQARMPTLTHWVGVAHTRRIDAPIVRLAEGELAFRRGDLGKAEALACQAVRGFTGKNRFASRALWIAGTSAHVSVKGETALEYFRAAQDSADNAVDERSALWGQFLAAEALERDQDAYQFLEDFTSLSENTVDDLLRVATGRLLIAAFRGDLASCLIQQEQFSHLVDRARDPVIACAFLNAYTGTLFISGQYDEALRAAQAQEQLAAKNLLDFVLPFVRLNTAAAMWGLRNFRTCRTQAVHFERLTSNKRLVTYAAQLLARVQLASGRAEDALEILHRVDEVAKGSLSLHSEHLAWESLAHAINGNTSEAKLLSKRATTMSRRMDVSGLIPWTRAVLLSPASRARRAAVAALAISRRLGNFDSFVTAYRAQPYLLELVASEGTERELLRTILERARDDRLAELVGIRISVSEAPGGLSMLSKREREVLGLVCQGLLNKEIGRTLFITEATVKVHVRKICRKLGVRTRTEAAMRAAELSD